VHISITISPQALQLLLWVLLPLLLGSCTPG
jgi:hypothetical protein